MTLVTCKLWSLGAHFWLDLYVHAHTVFLIDSDQIRHDNHVQQGWVLRSAMSPMQGGTPAVHTVWPENDQILHGNL